MDHLRRVTYHHTTKKSSTDHCTGLFSLYETLLLRRYPVQEYSDDGEHDIRQPQGDCRRKGARMYEHLAESQEEDVSKCQGDTYTDVPAYAAASFL